MAENADSSKKAGFKAIAKKELTFTGSLYSLVFSLLAILLIASGSLTGLDDYLTALVFQYGYQEPEAERRIMVVKKDQLTSELIGKNPSREEFAALFNFLGQTQKVKRNRDDAPQKFRFFSLEVGSFKNYKYPIVRNSYMDATGLTEALVLDLNSKEQKTGQNSIVKIDSFLFTPLSLSFIRRFAGGRGPLLLPTLGLFLEEDSLLHIDLKKAYKQKLAAVEALAIARKGDSEKALELMERWQRLLVNIFKFDLEINFRFFSDPETAFSMDVILKLEGLPSGFEVGPSSVIAFDFILQGNKIPELDKKLEAAIASSQAKVVLAGHTKIENESFNFVLSGEKKGKTELSKGRNRRKVTRQIKPAARFLQPGVLLGMVDMSAGNKSYVTEVPLFSALPAEKRLEPAFSLLTAMAALDQEAGLNGSDTYIAAMFSELESIAEDYFAQRFYGPLKIKDISIPVNKWGRMYLKYYGSSKKNQFQKAALPSVSFYECFSREYLEKYKKLLPPDSVARLKKAHSRTLHYFGKNGVVALVGPFELSDFDFFPTPLSLETPYTIQKEPLMGVEIHANAVLNILNRDYLKHVNSWHTIIALVLTTFLLGFLLDFFSPMVGAFITIFFMGGISWFGFYSYHQLNQVFYFSSMLLCYPAIWGLATLTNYLRQRARAQTTKDMFSRFVAADVVRYMLENPELVKPGGQKVELSIFFSDVAGFTSISEALSPEDLVVLLNEYLGAMTDILFEYGGTLDKFIGDAVMAFWNYPRKQPDHAVRACLCAIAMQRRIEELQVDWAKRGLPKVAARAGMNSAEVVVGYMGSMKAQMNFTCMGDGVNLAARLEGANKEYGTTLMISEGTYQQVKHVITARFLDFLAVKGKKEPVKVYELVCEKGKEPPEFNDRHKLYDHAIELHLERKWDEAIETFEKVLARWPDDGPSKTYIKRCQEYKQNPPPEGWDGRYILTHK